MKAMLCFFSIIILASLQMIFLNFMNIVPNLILVFVICIASMEKSRTSAIIISAFAGVVLDFAQSSPTGLNAILFMLIALVINMLSKKFSTHLGVVLFYIISSVIFYNLLYFMCGKFFFGSFNMEYIIFNIVLKELLITLVCGVPITLVFRKTYEIFRKA